MARPCQTPGGDLLTQTNRQRYLTASQACGGGVLLSHQSLGQCWAAAPLVVLEDDGNSSPCQAVLSCWQRIYSKLDLPWSAPASAPCAARCWLPGLGLPAHTSSPPLGRQAQALNHAAARRLLAAVTERFWSLWIHGATLTLGHGVDMLVLAPNVVRGQRQVVAARFTGTSSRAAGPALLRAFSVSWRGRGFACGAGAALLSKGT